MAKMIKFDVCYLCPSIESIYEDHTDFECWHGDIVIEDEWGIRSGKTLEHPCHEIPSWWPLPDAPEMSDAANTQRR